MLNRTLRKYNESINMETPSIRERKKSIIINCVCVCMCGCRYSPLFISINKNTHDQLDTCIDLVCIHILYPLSLCNVVNRRKCGRETKCDFVNQTNDSYNDDDDKKERKKKE